MLEGIEGYLPIPWGGKQEGKASGKWGRGVNLNPFCVSSGDATFLLQVQDSALCERT